ncbi:MAG TPA: CBS domain-containing protein [Thermodesulfobacteriaceae bacterium]|nr:CBS domain-containing protein [Thermodesulfobacteriaceae bacterium]
MKSISIKPLIVDLKDYAVISVEATLHDAIQILEESHERFFKAIHVHGGNRYKHRAVLVADQKDRIVGKLNQYDMIKGLEPRYDEIGDDSRLSRFGITRSFMHDQMRLFGLWQSPLSHICRKASSIKVRHIMRPMTPDCIISEDTALDEVIHRFIVYKRQLLLVNRGEETIGVVRLTDIFVEVCLTIKSCGLG